MQRRYRGAPRLLAGLIPRTRPASTGRVNLTECGSRLYVQATMMMIQSYKFAVFLGA